MKRFLSFLIAALTISMLANAQCTSTNATSCVCPPGGGTDCDLLPDIKASVDALQGGYAVYTQTGNSASGSQGSNDGRLRLNGTTPNIGYGPLDTRAINKWLCGTDTLLANPGSLCPDGRVPKRFVNQRIFHKNGNTMSYTDVPCGTLTYHPSHGHMHVDNWGVYTLRLQNPGDPNPLNWSIVGTGTKLAFCLLDIGSCTGSPTYCRDDNNNPQTTAQIPNNGIGNGQYGCSSTLQGISNGYYDTYSQSLDGMWIDIPPGTCNGQYYIVVQIDPNQNMIELNENNNVIAVPVTISNQTAPGSPVMKISANKPGAILPGSNITLTATAGSSYLWSPGGATTQSITVSNAGSYTCTVTNYCGTATSAPFVVTVLPAANVPSSGGASTCMGTTATITATNGGAGTMKWYNSPVSTTPLVTGASYTTPNLTNTTTYYVENEVTNTGATTHVGPLDNTIGSGAYQTTTPSTTWYEQFDAVSDLTLVSVKVFASTTGSRTFILQDRASTVLKSQSISVPAVGANVITLNWFVPAGAGYKLMVSGTPNLYYNTSGVSYPYSAPGICNIFGSYSGHSNYTFFYDFVVKSPDLVSKSGRVPVTVNVTDVTVFISALPPSLCEGESTTLGATGASTYLWNPGGATTSSITVTPSTNTVYSVIGTLNGCQEMETITIYVNPMPSLLTSFTGVNCFGNTNGTATAVASGGTPAYGYSWNTTPVQNTPTAIGLSGGNYAVTVTDANGCTATMSQAVAEPAALLSTASVTNTTCGFSNGTIDMTPSGGTAPYSYSWTPGGASSQDLSGIAGGSYSVLITDANGCTHSNTFSVGTSGTAPSTPAAVSGNDFICKGALGNSYSVAPVAGATSYVWSVPSGATIGSGQGTTALSIDFSATQTSGSVCVYASNVCGSSTPVCKTLTVVTAKPGVPSSISGPSTSCPGNTGVVYSCPAVVNTQIYNWILPSGSSIASGSGTNSITVNFDGTFTKGYIKVSAGNCFGTSSLRSFYVNGKPTTPGTMTGAINGICAGSVNIPYSIVAVSAATGYTWTAPANASIVSGQGTTSVLVNFSGSFTSGALKVTANNVCGSSGARSTTIRSVPVAPGALNGPVTVCANQTGVAYSIAAVAGATSYQWTAPNGAIIASGQGTTSVTVNFGPSSGTLTVRALNACGQSSGRNVGITINCRTSSDPISELSLFPNPAHDKINISFYSSADGKYKISVGDVTGRIVYTSVGTVMQGQNQITFSLTDFAKGIYMLSFDMNEQQLVKKVVIE